MEMMKNLMNIQDQFLNRVRRDRFRVTVELTSGRRLDGIVLAFDNFGIMLRADSDQLIYKHAICSLTIGERLELSESKEGGKHG